MRYAKVHAGAVVEIVDIPGGAPAGSVVGEHPTKPYLLPLVGEKPDHDADVEVLDASLTIGATRVTRTWTKRVRTEEELATLRARPLARIELEFARRVESTRQVLATLAECGVDVPKPTAREDALAAVRDAKRAEVAALTSAADLREYDAAAGWD